MSHLIPFPSFPVSQERHYRIRPRTKKSFHTVLDAADMIDSADERTSLLRMQSDRAQDGGAEQLTLAFEHPLRGGRICEQLELCRTPEGLRSTHFTRSVYSSAGQRIRYEEVEFGDSTLPLPEGTYPEVWLPFLIAWDPLDGRERQVFAWVCDRFVARTRYKSLGRKTINLASGRMECVELMMYPDINDWVHLGKMITRLLRPFMPKYRIWCAPEPPFHVVKFEGSYGPPGAPEIILELG